MKAISSRLMMRITRMSRSSLIARTMRSRRKNLNAFARLVASASCEAKSSNGIAESTSTQNQPRTYRLAIARPLVR